MLTQIEQAYALLPDWVDSAAGYVSALLLVAALALMATGRRRERKPSLVVDGEGRTGIRFSRGRRRPRNPKRWRNGVGFVGMALVVLLGFGLSANTSMVFAEARLHLVQPWTVLIGLALEGIVLGLTLWSWAFEDKGPARVAYMLVFAQAIGAVEVVRFQQEDLGTAAVRIVGPIMLAYGLHKMLRLETKLKKIEIRSDGMLARMWRDQMNRLESLLGIGARGADAAEIARGKAREKAVRLATTRVPRWKFWHSEEKVREALAEAANRSLEGLSGTDRKLAERDLVDQIDAKNSFRDLMDRKKDYRLVPLRPARAVEVTPGMIPDDPSSLTSGDTVGHTLGHGPVATQTHSDRSQSSPGPKPDPKADALDIYVDLRAEDPDNKPPSQNKFVEKWYAEGKGMSAQDVRGLYKYIHERMSQESN